MKNSFKKSFIILTTLIALVGCNFSGASKDINPSIPSSIDNSESINSTASSGNSFSYDANTRYESESMDANVYKMIEENVGQVAYKIPALKADAFVTYFDKKQSTDIAGNPLQISTTRVLAGALSSKEIEAYGETLEKQGFVYSMESECYYAKASATDCMYIYFTYFKQTGRLNMEIYRKTIRESTWDDELAPLVIGTKIPHIECGAYEYYFESSSLELFIYFVDVTLSQITDYQNELTKSNWYRTSDTSEYDVYSNRKDSDIRITMYQGIDSFGDLYLLVVLSNNWPLYLLLSTTGTDLPKSSRGDYYGYTTDESSTGKYYTQIEYDNCEYDDFIAYCQELSSRSYGYSLADIGEDNPTSQESTNPGFGTIYSAYYERQVVFDDDGSTLYSEVDVMYSSGLKRLIIIIWA